VTTALLLAAASLFALGCFGVLARRRAEGMVMAGQLLGLAAVLALLALNRPAGQANRGHAFALLLAVAGMAQLATGLALARIGGSEDEAAVTRPAGARRR
jgi:NADH:ubiquinone oxidoreductase subunit K